MTNSDFIEATDSAGEVRRSEVGVDLVCRFAPVQIQTTFEAGKPVKLFDRKFDPGAAVSGYDVSPDGQTFVMTRSEHDNPTQIRVVLNWLTGSPEQK